MEIFKKSLKITLLISQIFWSQFFHSFKFSKQYFVRLDFTSFCPLVPQFFPKKFFKKFACNKQNFVRLDFTSSLSNF